MKKPSLKFLGHLLLATTLLVCLSAFGCHGSSRKNYSKFLSGSWQIEKYPVGIVDSFWSLDSQRLYFAIRSRKGNTITTSLESYAVQTKMVREIYSGEYLLLHFTINECEEIAAVAIDYKAKKYGIFIIDATGKARFQNFQGIDEISRPICWLWRCDGVAFWGYGYKKDTLALRKNALFLWKNRNGRWKPSLVLNGLTPAYNFLPLLGRSFVSHSGKERIIFDCFAEPRQKNAERTYDFWAVEIDSGKFWRIVDFGWLEGLRVGVISWFYNPENDCIYYFSTDESGRLATLWRINEAGGDKTEILEIPTKVRPHSHALVSWSADADLFVFRVEDDTCKRSLYIVNTKTKEVKQLLSDTDIVDYWLSPDGQKVAYTKLNGTLSILNVRDGTVEGINPLN